MLNAFIPAPLPGQRLVPFVADGPQGGKRLFQDLPAGSYAGLFTIVEDITQADLVVVPHEYSVLQAHPDYLRAIETKAQEAGKRMLISAYQDDPRPILMKNAVILRASAYQSTLRPYEILTPAYIEDLSIQATEPLKKGQRPTVGFMGKAGFASLKEMIKYLIRNYVVRRGVDREGIYFRRKCLRVLENDARIELHSTRRTRFSANAATIELDPAEARAQYLASIRESLFTLAPRGDGNFSLRFYETLALGRIPILIDTDMPLPLEDQINYDEFILRVPSNRIHELSDIIWDFWIDTTEEELIAMQRKARETFEKHLFMPTFLKQILTREHLTEIP